ncbi:hypothetical protein [Chitinolyticbacter albus]|uniref:hypothetical protein n=1 Tax=Chitinolyticbacter albus TaxID=2961951 RepID=UPI00210D169F|nr:hypothetical protein [Chitinolyticbacter albus]
MRLVHAVFAVTLLIAGHAHAELLGYTSPAALTGTNSTFLQRSNQTDPSSSGWSVRLPVSLTPATGFEQQVADDASDSARLLLLVVGALAVAYGRWRRR